MGNQDSLGLVADVGGTNTRLAFVGPGGVMAETVARRSNAAFDSFEALLDDYLQGTAVDGQMVVAVAGPVGGRQAQLTNRNWLIDADAVAARFGARHMSLMNDLEALGQAVPTIAPEAVEPLHDGAALGQPGQALVVNLGTGYNVAAVHLASGSVLISE